MPAVGSSAPALTPGGCALQVVGEGRCPIVDTWWQTETGAHMITPLPGATTLRPGSATLPFFGVEPAVLNEKGEEMEGECEGLVFPASLICLLLPVSAMRSEATQHFLGFLERQGPVGSYCCWNLQSYWRSWRSRGPLGHVWHETSSLP